MNALHFSQTHYKKALGDQTWVRTSIALLPNFFGVTQPFGGGTLGFSYAIPDSTIENQQQKFSIKSLLDNNNPTDFIINFNNQDVVYNIGPSYAFKFSDRLSAGITLYGIVHQQRTIFNQEFQAATGYHWVNSYRNYEEYGIRPILGLMWSPLDKISIGATFSQPRIFYAKDALQLSCARNNSAIYPDTATCANGKIIISNSADNIRNIKPWNTEISVAYFQSTSLLMTATASAYENFSANTPLVNIASGIEYYFLGNYALRSGLFTNFSNSPDTTAGRLGQSDHVNLYGFTFSLSNFTRSSSLTGGFSFSTGEGHAQVVADSLVIQDVSMYVLSLYLSASYSY
ncbi:MAG: hypothetical protein OEW08_00815 [Gammaproteobacteria bacterium]|nr:hypothetical protein [Gammaproteobacteria bacterium]